MKRVFYALMSLLVLSIAGCQKEPEPIKVSSISVSPSSLSLTEGETGTLIATVSPSNADNQKVIWTSSNASVAGVNNGVVNAVKEGSATITAMSDDGNKTATCIVEVKAKRVPVESVELDKSSLEMTESDETTLAASIMPENASNKNVRWSSSDNTIATVDNGKVRGIKAGYATITVTSEDNAGIIATCAITVSPLVCVEFEDGKFESYCLKNFDINKDGKISDSEASCVTDINVRGIGITSLKGIEYFVSLTNLDCSANELSSLDVSNNVLLESLRCRYCNLTTLDISRNVALTVLECNRNRLINLSVANNKKLTNLDCGENNLATLDVSGCPELSSLNCWANKLTKLDLSSNPQLETINCARNRIAALDFNSNGFLTEISCWENQLSQIDVSKNTHLTYLHCDDNNLTALDVSNCLSMTELGCSSNKIHDLKIGNNTVLTRLMCSSNQLTSLDVSCFSQLTYLSCMDMAITELDLSNNLMLSDLDCRNNQIGILDVSKNTELTSFYCMNNRIQTLDVSNNLKLSVLWCQNNPYLTEIWLKTGQGIASFEWDASAEIKYKG